MFLDFRLALAVICGITMLSGIVFAFCGSYHGFRAAYCRRSDAPFRWWVALNRFNAAWFADQLDERGLEHRRRAFKFQGLALAIWAVMAISALALFLTS